MRRIELLKNFEKRDLHFPTKAKMFPLVAMTPYPSPNTIPDVALIYRIISLVAFLMIKQFVSNFYSCALVGYARDI